VKYPRSYTAEVLPWLQVQCLVGGQSPYPESVCVMMLLSVALFVVYMTINAAPFVALFVVNAEYQWCSSL